MISEPSRRISSCSRPTALCSRSSERNEFEQTSSASAAVLWAAVVRTGRISCSTTGTPRAAICQAASAPARPPPMMWIGLSVLIYVREVSEGPERNHKSDLPLGSRSVINARGIEPGPTSGSR